MVANVNNVKLTDFTVISLTEIARNKIYIYYAAICKLHTNKKLK